MAGDDIDRPRPSWAVRFSLTMHALNPGVLIVFRWVTRVVVLVPYGVRRKRCRG